MTCSTMGALPTVAGGALVCCLATSLSTSLAKGALRLGRHAIDQATRGRYGARVFGVQKEHGQFFTRVKALFAHFAQQIAQFMLTSPKSISTTGRWQRWQTVQCSATSSNSSQWRKLTPRQVCSSYKRPRSRAKWPKFYCAGWKPDGAQHMGGAFRFCICRSAGSL